MKDYRLRDTFHTIGGAKGLLATHGCCGARNMLEYENREVWRHDRPDRSSP